MDKQKAATSSDLPSDLPSGTPSGTPTGTPSDLPSDRSDRHVIDTLLSDTFNAILRIEERSLNNRLCEGLSISELHTIAAIGLDEENPMKVVATRLGVTFATLTSAMDKLEHKGYAERTRSETDRRQVLVKLSSKGRKAFRIHEAFHSRMVDSALEALEEHEKTIFVRALGKIKWFFDNEYESLRMSKA